MLNRCFFSLWDFQDALISWWSFGERGIYYTAFPKLENDPSVYIKHHWVLVLYEGTSGNAGLSRTSPITMHSPSDPAWLSVSPARSSLPSEALSQQMCLLYPCLSTSVHTMLLPKLSWPFLSSRCNSTQVLSPPEALEMPLNQHHMLLVSLVERFSAGFHPFRLLMPRTWQV